MPRDDREQAAESYQILVSEIAKILGWQYEQPGGREPTGGSRRYIPSYWRTSHVLALQGPHRNQRALPAELLSQRKAEHDRCMRS